MEEHIVPAPAILLQSTHSVHRNVGNLCCSEATEGSPLYSGGGGNWLFLLSLLSHRKVIAYDSGSVGT
jgi:hypothetical protein